MMLTADPFNAFLDRPPEPAAPAPGGPLAGLTFAVKDIFDVKGWRTGCGNPQKLDTAAPAGRHAWAVEKLLGAGAEFVGKTQTDELAFSLFGQNSHFPWPVNAAAPERITGGSSSGSAAAVAGGLADIALGSDTGGSVRAPASFCGLWGIRPTHGRLLLDGVMPLAPSLDTVGFFSRDREVFGRVASVFFGPPPEEAESIRLLSFPVLDDLVFAQALDEYRRLVGLVAAALDARPSRRTIAQPVDDLYWCFRRIQGFEAWSAHGAWLSEADRGLGPGVRERFEAGSQITPETYAAEAERRAGFRAALLEQLGEDGVLVLPTVPTAAPFKDSSVETFNAYREQALKLLCWGGLSGCPQVNLPLGRVENAPFGISLMGAPGSDARLAALALRVAPDLAGGI